MFSIDSPTSSGNPSTNEVQNIVATSSGTPFSNMAASSSVPPPSSETMMASCRSAVSVRTAATSPNISAATI